MTLFSQNAPGPVVTKPVILQKSLITSFAAAQSLWNGDNFFSKLPDQGYSVAHLGIYCDVSALTVADVPDPVPSAWDNFLKIFTAARFNIGDYYSQELFDGEMQAYRARILPPNGQDYFSFQKEPSLSPVAEAVYSGMFYLPLFWPNYWRPDWKHTCIPCNLMKKANLETTLGIIGTETKFESLTNCNFVLVADLIKTKSFIAPPPTKERYSTFSANVPFDVFPKIPSLAMIAADFKDDETYYESLIKGGHNTVDSNAQFNRLMWFINENFREQKVPFSYDDGVFDDVPGGYETYETSQPEERGTDWYRTKILRLIDSRMPLGEQIKTPFTFNIHAASRSLMWTENYAFSSDWKRKVENIAQIKAIDGGVHHTEVGDVVKVSKSKPYALPLDFEVDFDRMY